MKQLLFIVAIFAAFFVALTTGTALFDPFYATEAGLAWIVIKPIFGLAFIGSVVIFGCLLILMFLVHIEDNKKD